MSQRHRRGILEEDSDQVTKEIEPGSNIDDFLRGFDDDTLVRNVVESLPYNSVSQRDLIQLQELVKKIYEAEKLRDGREDSVEEKIRKLSEDYKREYPKLVDRFKEWKPAREKLIGTLRRSSNNLDRNSTVVSSIRIVTSAADIFGTLARVGGKSSDSWANFAMEHASAFGLMSICLEMVLSKKMHSDVNKAIETDQELFRNIAKWFKQAEKLDNAVSSFFPFGIDADIAKRIARSASDVKDYNKIFMSIVASNVKGNPKYFHDKKFLEKADRFSNSDAGKQWFHKNVLEDDPTFSHSMNSCLNEDIQNVLRISPTETPELYIDGMRTLHDKVKVKVTLNVMTMIWAFSNLWYGKETEESNLLKKLLKKANEELEKMKEILSLLKPSGFPADYSE